MNAHPDEAWATVARFLKLPPPAVAAVAVPRFKSKLDDEHLAPRAAFMKYQRMIRGDASLKGLIVP